MLNLAIIANGQRNVKLFNNRFAGYDPVAREPASLSFGSAGNSVAAATARQRAIAAGQFGNILKMMPPPTNKPTRVRYNGYGGYHRFGAYGDDPSYVLQDPGDGSDYGTQIGFTSGMGTGNTSSGDASASGDGTSFWDSAGSFVGSLVGAGSKIVGSGSGGGGGQTSHSNLLGGVLNALGIGGGKSTPTNTPTQTPPNRTGLYLGGAAALLGVYLLLKK